MGLHTRQAKEPQRARFAFWFFRSVAVFLALTAALKLFSVVAELPLLRSSDPVLLFLTVRQSTFAAALLEIGVAYWLFRRSVDPASPWVILWLVAIFTTYHLGLHAVGFKGDCNCFGHLPYYVPLSRPWLEWLSPLTLVLMGLGSVSLLATKRLACAPNGAAIEDGSGSPSSS